MAKKEITCTVEMTEGAEQRITDAFVDLYYGLLDGTYKGALPPAEDIRKEEDRTA